MIAKLIAHGTSRDGRARGSPKRSTPSQCEAGYEHRLPRRGRAASALCVRQVQHPVHRRGVPARLRPVGSTDLDPSLFVSVAAAAHWRYAERSARIAGQVPGHERALGDARVVYLRGTAHPGAHPFDPKRPGGVLRGELVRRPVRMGARRAGVSGHPERQADRRPPRAERHEVPLGARGRGGDAARAHRARGANAGADAGQAAARPLEIPALADAGPSPELAVSPARRSRPARSWR